MSLCIDFLDNIDNLTVTLSIRLINYLALQSMDWNVSYSRNKNIPKMSEPNDTTQIVRYARFPQEDSD